MLEEDKVLIEKLLNRFYESPKDMWIYYDHTFNSWEFPLEFYDLIPNWWFDSSMDRKHQVLKPIAKLVKDEFGLKEELRYHNVQKGDMTDEEFEYWFKNKDEEWFFYNYYDKKRNIEKIQWWKEDVYQKLVELNIF